jgi:hypothetical protein
MSALDHAAIVESEPAQALSHEIADLRHELANVQARLAERDKKFIDIADTIVTGLDKVEAWVNKAIEARVTRSEAVTLTKISERFGELLGRISAIDPAQARAAKSGEPFKFVNERQRDDEITELPNPLPSRRNIN